MLAYLPFPYHDELLYSIIARYLVRIGVNQHRSIITHIFGRVAKPNVFLPSSLGIVAERTRLLWRMTGEEIADRFTLFPYYVRYLPKKRMKKCLQVVLSNNGTGIHLLLGSISRRIEIPRCLRFCSNCRKNDISNYGETFWHRSHQLAGVLVCPEHGVPLINAGVLMRPKHLQDYADATQATTHIRLRRDSMLDSRQCEKALVIGQRCRDMLIGSMLCWKEKHIAQSYRQAALDRGFIEGGLKLSLATLEREFCSFYGKQLLQNCGCDFPLRKNSSWFRNIFRTGYKTFHPVEHALVQIYLESISGSSMNAVAIGFGPWKCPNPYGKHTEKHPIKEPLIYGGQRGKRVASAKCSCGYHFTFLHTSDTDPKLPVVNKVMQYGPTWEVEVQRLRQRGLSMNAIARRLGLHDSNVRDILNKRRRSNGITPEKIKKWRCAWSELLAQVPHRSRHLARKGNKGLYLRLWRHDRNWLLAEPRNWSRKPSSKPRVCWSTRDKEWSQLLRSAAETIRAAVPLRQVTRTAAIIEAGLSLKILARLDKLQKCRTALCECCESLEDYRERRLRAAAENMLKMDLPMHSSQLLRRSSLTRKSLTPRLTAVLQDLVHGP